MKLDHENRFAQGENVGQASWKQEKYFRNNVQTVGWGVAGYDRVWWKVLLVCK